MKKIQFTIIIGLITQYAFAQNTAIDNDSLVKKSFLPTEIEMKDNRQPIIYNVPNQDLSLNYKALPVKPLSFQPNKKGEHNWVKIGLGNLNNRQVVGNAVLPIGSNSVHLMGGYSYARANQSQAHTHVTSALDYHHQSEKNSANIGIAFSDYQQNKYGFEKDINANAPSQNWWNVEVNGGWQPKSELDVRRNTNVLGKIRFLKTNTDLTELHADIDWQYKVKAGKGNWQLGFMGQYNNMYNKDSSNDVSFIQPTAGYLLQNNNTFFRIGLSAIAGNEMFYPMPYLEVRTKLSSKTLFHLGTKGNVLQANLYDAFSKNPFANYDINKFRVGRLYQVFAGLTVSAGTKATVNFKVSYNDYRNAIMYNNYELLNQNIMVTSFISTSSMHYQTGFLYQATQDFQIGFDGGMQKFIGVQIIDMPKVDINAYSHLQITQKVKWKLNYVYYNGMIINGMFLGWIKELKPIHDLHTELSIIVHKKWSIYGQVNNILNLENARWYGYNSYKSNFMVGLQWHQLSGMAN
jgi:hypothetical protein